jgi:hypothetical protein
MIELQPNDFRRLPDRKSPIFFYPPMHRGDVHRTAKVAEV